MAQNSPRHMKSSDESSDGQKRQEPMPSPYKTMIYESYEVSIIRNFFAGFFNWLLLAGFVVFPGTFTSLSRAGILNDTQPGRLLQYAVRHTSLLCIASLCCAIGFFGLAWLWWMLQKNYVWLIARILLPGFLNAVMALITTLINVYTAQEGKWSGTATGSMIAIGFCGLVMGGALVFYQFWMLAKVKKMSSALLL